MNPPRREAFKGDEAYRQRSLEIARVAAQEEANKFQKEIAIFVNEEGTALCREAKFVPSSIEVKEIIKPSVILPLCESCKQAMSAKSKATQCGKCQRKAKR